MIHFIERKDLIRWLAKNCTRKAVVRAMDEGSVELLGVFARLSPKSESGWLVQVTSNTGKIWNVEVIPRHKRVAIFMSDLKPPWERWIGSDSNPLYSGDNPEEYARLRDEA